MRSIARSLPFLLLVVVALPLAAAIDVVKPEDAGLSGVRLQRINQMIQRHIDAGNISGGITLVARQGRVAHFQKHGVMDIESKKPMSQDAIFRMASLTKPIVGVAIMMLVEEGKVRLNDPVSTFIPEFRELKVAVANPPNEPGISANEIRYHTVPANREITIRDLLTHVSGLVSGPVSSQEAAKAPRKPAERLADYIPRLAAVPLEFQPGTRWSYSPAAGFDTLARVVEVAARQTFDQFLGQRVFEPLGMKDTFFGPAEGRLSRVATSYRRTDRGLQKQPNNDPRFLPGNTYYSGGGGLSSTVEDYLRFSQVLVNGGEFGGRRLLSPRTVELMRSVHVSDTLPGRPAGEGYGLSVRVISDSGARGTMLSDGSFGWSGAFGTHFWIDPRKQLIAILMVQTTPNNDIRADFETAVMQAVID